MILEGRGTTGPTNGSGALAPRESGADRSAPSPLKTAPRDESKMKRVPGWRVAATLVGGALLLCPLSSLPWPFHHAGCPHKGEIPRD
jgi:hypothetical protein